MSAKPFGIKSAAREAALTLTFMFGVFILGFLGWVAHDMWGEEAQLQARAAVTDTARWLPLSGQRMTFDAWASCLGWRERARRAQAEVRAVPLYPPHQEAIAESFPEVESDG